jgi:hypothetical protein
LGVGVGSGVRVIVGVGGTDVRVGGTGVAVGGLSAGVHDGIRIRILITKQIKFLIFIFSLPNIKIPKYITSRVYGFL